MDKEKVMAIEAFWISALCFVVGVQYARDEETVKNPWTFASFVMGVLWGITSIVRAFS